MALQDKLNALKAESEGKAPADKLAIMHRATEELQNSGILERVAKAGSPFPEFTLLNYRGKKSAPATC